LSSSPADQRHCGIAGDRSASLLGGRKPKKEIAMYINSPGGLVTAGLAIYDTMQYIRPPCRRFASSGASMASLLLCAGQKGMRFALPNARIMVHQPSASYRPDRDIERHAQDILALKDRLNRLYAQNTGRELSVVERRWIGIPI